MSARALRLTLCLALLSAAGLVAADDTVSGAGYYQLIATQGGNGDAVAVLEFEDGVRNMVRAGDPIGECLVTAIDDNSLQLACPGADLHLPLNTARIRSTSQPGRWSPDPGSYQYSVSGKALKKLLADKERLAANFCIVPHVKDGHVHGYRIDALSAANPLADLGLAVDDVIIGINGAHVDEPGSFLRTVHTLASAQSFDLEVERGSKVLALTYEPVQ